MHSDLFSCDNLDKFIGCIQLILPYRGYSESKFFICKLDDVEFLTKLSFYKKTNPEIYNKNNSEVININPHDAEIGILKILKKKIIDANISPCILELLFTQKCNSLDGIIPDPSICDKFLIDKPTNTKDIVLSLFCKHLDLVKSGLAHKKFSFLVLEECDITFHDFIRRYIEGDGIEYTIFLSLMFQIIYTMYAIKKIYPNFRHADLHTENVMLKFINDYEFDMLKPQFLVFIIDGVSYYVPYFGIICKIIDFGFASIPEENIRSFASEDMMLMSMRSKNDLLFFFHDIYDIAGKNNTITKMLSQLEPNQTFKHYNVNNINKNEQKIPTYETMIKNSIFHIYKRTDVLPEHIYHTYTSL